MKLMQILKNIDCFVENFEDFEVENLSCNANEKNQNGIFFCLKGTISDGHNYISRAIKNGAKAVVVERRQTNLDVNQIVVKSSRSAMSKIASNFYDNPEKKLKLVLITGTNGKTTSSYLTSHILRENGAKVGLIGTNGVFVNETKIAQSLTTPDPIELHKYLKTMVDSSCEYAVMEASAHAIYFKKLDGIRADVLALTNITQDHLDFFKTMKNYSAVKEGFFTNQHAKKFVVNFDSDAGKRILKNNPSSCLSFGTTRNSDVCVTALKRDITGSKFKISFEGQKHTLKSNLIGDFNLLNCATVFAICKQLGLENEKIIKGIESFKSVPGRFNVYHSDKGGFDVVVDYAHTPDGLKNVLLAAKSLCRGKLINVFGCGGNRDQTKRKIMGQISTQIADLSVITSDNPRWEDPSEIIAQIKQGATKNCLEIENRKMAINKALDLAKKKDVVLICGKGAEDYQEICGVKHHFSDKEVVLEGLNAKGKRNNKGERGID